MRRYIVILIALLALGSINAGAQHYDRGYDVTAPNVFVPKGTWVAGGTVKYTQHNNVKSSILVINDINSKGYSVSANPELLYVFKDNMGAGIKFSYDRGMLDIASADLSVSEITMSIRDCYKIHHKFSAYAFYRAYIPFSATKRIALYADLLFGGSYKQGKVYNAGGASVVGSYEENYSIELAVNPGIVAFLTDRLAIEMNVGLFGASYNWSEQIHNQASRGEFDSTSAGFMVNLLSIGVGMSYYFL